MSPNPLDTDIELHSPAGERKITINNILHEDPPRKITRAPLLPVIAIALLALTALAFLGLTLKERSLRTKTEMELKEVKYAKEAVEKDLEETLKVKIALETKYNEAKQQADALSQQLAEEKRAKEEMVLKLNDKESEVNAAKAELASEKEARSALAAENEELNREMAGLSDELAKAKEGYQEVSGQLEQLRLAKAALESRVKEMLGGKVDLEKIVVTPARTTTQPRAIDKNIEGKVLVVNREYNFVILNRGQRDGVSVGVPFGVYREGQLIAKLQVEKLYDSMSAASIISAEKKYQIREGDIVRPI